MKPLIFDIETDGLLPELTRVHLLVIKDMETGASMMYRRNALMDTIEEGVRRLEEATKTGRIVCGHNVIKFDIPALKKVFPWFRPAMRNVRDTLTWSKVLWADGLWDIDKKLVLQGKLPKHLQNRYSLEAFGYRLGNFKGDYSGSWAEWNQEMEDYCYQDADVTGDLWAKLFSKGWAEESLELEHAVAHIISRQVTYGFLFDREKAAKLYRVLVAKRLELQEELRKAFGKLYFREGPETTPSRTVRVQQEQLGLNPNDPVTKGRGKDKIVTGYRFRTFDYEEDAPHQKIKLVEFNPTSRDHIGIWLKRMYGWVPEEFTDEGKPKVDDAVMAKLPYPEAPKLKEYLLVEKRIGMLAEGNEAWLKRLGADGRIHGDVESNGAVTGRMTHKKPNMAQVPAGYSPYGHECRELFIVPPGKKLVGCDASALELCDLAGYMAAYDNGDYVRVVLEGDKKLGTDIHSVNARALGLDPKGSYFDGESGRDIAKTWFYAFIYGAGDEKLGFILAREKGRGAKKRGGKSRKDFMENLPALGTLVEKVKQKVKQVGHLKGLDGRILRIRSDHAALNTLLQSAGAVQMKRALVILDTELQEVHGLTPGVHYEFVANVHDEWQIEVDEDKAALVGKVAADAIRQAGEHYKFRCPLSGEYRVGNNWAETH